MIADIPTGSWIVLVGALVSWYSTLDYARATARGKLRPSLASWGVWTATAALGTAAAWAAGSTVGVVISAATFARCAQVLLPAAVVAVRDRLRVRRGLPALTVAPEHNSYQRVLDVCCLAACGVIGVAWAVTKDDMLALKLSIAVDGVACLPTIYHGWQGQEHPRPFLLGMVGPILGLLVVRERMFADYGWPLYELGVNILMAIPPLVVGWPVEETERRPVRPARRQRMAVPAAGVALYAAALALVFVVIPPPAPAGGSTVSQSLPAASAAGEQAAAAANQAAVVPAEPRPAAVAAANPPDAGSGASRSPLEQRPRLAAF